MAGQIVARCPDTPRGLGVRRAFVRAAAAPILGAILALVAALCASTPTALAATYVVNSTADLPDANVGDALCDVDAVADGLQCTLRAAIEQANASVGDDTIEFAIPGSGPRVIIITAAAGELPALTTPVVIDGPSQGRFSLGVPAYTGPPLVELRGSTGVDVGLRITGAVVTVRGLGIGGFDVGIVASGGSNHVLVGNHVGVAADGVTAVPNATYGIELSGGAAGVTIGGGGSGERNVVSGNTGVGILVQLATGTRILGNYIGTTSNGATALPNEVGVVVVIADGTIVGGAVPVERNVISGNTEVGVELVGLCGCGPELTRVIGNYVGTNAAGTAAVANGVGVVVRAGLGIVVGGTGPGAGNVISGNAQDGVQVLGEGSERIEISGNRVGTTPAGTAALPNGRDGIALLPDPALGGAGPRRTVVGSDAPGAGNLISGNGRHGVYLFRTRQETQVVRNLIGVDASGGGSIGNGGDGILLERTSRLTVRENTIANSGRSGVVMMPRTTANVGNVLTGNAIFANGGVGIDVTDTVDGNGAGDGKTENDAAEADGAQNFPVLTAATTSSAGTVVAGTLASSPNASFRVELFARPTCDPVGNGEGRAFLGALDVGTSPGGTTTFSQTLPRLPDGQVVTATATNPDRQTSEFSACKAVTTAGIAISPTSGLQTTEAGGEATFTVALTTVPTANVTIGLSSSRPSEGTIAPGSITFTPADALTPRTVTVTGVADGVADGNQSYAIVTAPAASADPAYGGLDARDVTVVNQDAATLPTVSIFDAAARERTTALRFEVVLSPASTQPVTVEWMAVSGTAVVNNDVLSENRPIVFQPGETRKEAGVVIVWDRVEEDTETFSVKLVKATNAAIGRDVATGSSSATSRCCRPARRARTWSSRPPGPAPSGSASRSRLSVRRRRRATR